MANQELKKFINEKIRMLRKDFKMKLTDEEKEHMRGLENEIQVDQYAHNLLMNKL